MKQIHHIIYTAVFTIMSIASAVSAHVSWAKVKAMKQRIEARDAECASHRQRLDELSKINTRLQHEVYRLREEANER